MGAVPPNHASRRARVVFVDPAQQQVQKITEQETHALDRVIVAISVDPTLGIQRGQMRDYRDDVEDIRVIYYRTDLNIIVVSYFEV